MVNLKRKERIAKRVKLFLENQIAVFFHFDVKFHKIIFKFAARKKRSRSITRIPNKIKDTGASKTAKHYTAKQSVSKYI